MDFKTIPQMFLKVCDKYGDKKIAYKFKKDGVYVGLTYAALRDTVEKFALGLSDMGIKKGDRIGIVSENRIEWIVSDFAINSIGAVDVPIFPTNTSRQEEYIFDNSGASVIIVSNNFQLAKVLEFKDRLPLIKYVIVMNEEFDCTDPDVLSMTDIIKRGAGLSNAGDRRAFLIKSALSVKPDDLLTIIYTSGTTGNPKGVMLTNDNIMSNLEGIEIVDLFSSSDEFLSFLPLCHAYERTTGFYAAFSTGATTALAESLETVGTNINEIRPTIMTTVPKLLEVVRKKIIANIEKSSNIRKKIFYRALEIGKAYLRAKLNGDASFALTSKFKLADKLVFTKIRQRTGGRLRRFVSGGAALPPDVCEFFCLCGFEVLEGYGLTEASPVVSVSMPGNIEIGTIGKPLPGVNVKIADDGEILVKGRNVMKGYWQDENATTESIDPEGWLHTGDVGRFTDKGNIRITDRKKNIIVSSGGKNIAPQPIENVLSQSRFIEHVILIGDKRDYITALLTPDYNHLKEIASEMNISFKKETELITNDKIISLIKKDIDTLQKDLAKFERVRKFKLLSEPFSVENGELTPKLSIKRHVVERKYSDVIDEMYGKKQ